LNEPEGLKALVDLALGKLAPKEENEDGEKAEEKPADNRVQLESARVLIRLLDTDSNKKLVAESGAIPPVLDLVQSPFEILQAEGLKATQSLAEVDELKSTLIEAGTVQRLEAFQSNNQQLKEIAVNILNRLK